jgi:hypothetical protein
MKKTVGTPDRALRVVLAIGAVIGAGIIGFVTIAGIVLLAVAAILLLTAASRMCPLYSALRISTCPRDAGGTALRDRVHHRAA